MRPKFPPASTKFSGIAQLRKSCFEDVQQTVIFGSRVAVYQEHCTI